MKLHSTGERRLIKKQVEEALHPGRKGLRERQRGLGSLGAQGWGGVWMGDASSMRVQEWGRERATVPTRHLFADELFCMHCVRLC